MIVIHFDFSDGTEISYLQGLEKKYNFTTNCLDFFCFDTEDNVRVLKKDGSYIDRDELLANPQIYCQKEIRTSHNLQKMLKANSFEFKHEKNILAMKTIEITLPNIKKRVVWKLGEKINILIGHNNSGKTYLLNQLPNEYTKSKIVYIREDRSFYHLKTFAFIKECKNEFDEVQKLKLDSIFPNWQNIESNQNLSLGFMNFFEILSDVFFSRNKKSLIIIDTPEIGLHLDIQVQLIDVLMTFAHKDSTFIFATHAPALVRRGWKDKVFFMELNSKDERGILFEV